MKAALLLLVFVFYGQGGAYAQPWTWQNPLPQGNTLNAVTFVNAQIGWAVGDAGTIVHTADGGATWQGQTAGTSRTLAALHFVDGQTGWAVGGNPGVILHTVDGGATWEAQQNAVVDQLRAVHFVDD